MRILYPSFFILLSLFFSPKAAACGYDWVGECSSAIHLRINGSLDSFILADCPSGIRFNDLQLGVVRTLSLANARAITWESCINHVSGVAVKYRIYEQNGAGGAFQTLDLNQDYFTLVGPYTTRYRSKASNIDLTTGLTIGKTYVMEVYLLAAVDTVGNDLIPETTIVKNNGGQNYKLSFTYGGPSAAPFVVVPTHVVSPICHGDSNGSIAVSVWGDQTGLFYNWSNVALNFFQQNGIPAGTYTVSVTGASYATSQTVSLSEPDALSLSSVNVQPVSCGGASGSISVTATGGTAPYTYLWTNGQTSASAVFSNSGNYALTVTDAHLCSLVQSINLPNSGLIQQNSTKTICAGQSITIGGQTFTVPGQYQLTLPGNNGCDTLLHLTLSESNPAALLSSLPDHIVVSCSTPSVNLCATPAPDALFQWSKDGIPATPTPCLLATAGGVYTLTVQQGACMASKNVQSEEHLVGPLVFAGGTMEYLTTCYVVDSTVIHLHAGSAGLGPQFEWILQGQVIATGDSMVFYYEGNPIPIPAVPSVRVTDQYGCKNSTQPTIGFVFPPLPPSPYVYFSADLCQGLVAVEVDVFGGTGSDFTLTWNGDTILDHHFYAAPGPGLLELSDQEGCKSSFNFSVPPLFMASVEDSPYPGWHTGSIDIYESTSAWFDYIWEDGSIGNSRQGLAPGDYCVTITEHNTSCSVDTCFTVHGLVATLEPAENPMRLFPSPARPGDMVQIEVPEAFKGSLLRTALIDACGQKILGEQVLKTGINLVVQLPADLPDGIYWLRVFGPEDQMSGKICIKK